MRNKMMRAALCAALTVLALTCVAFAATDGYTADRSGTVDYNANTGKYTASYGSAEAGQEAVLLVVSGTENSYAISEKTIMYIDQKTVAGDGSVSFEFIPKSTPDSLVLLGVAGASEPVLLGTVVGQGVTVSGTVKYQGTYSTATVALKNKSTGEVLYETATDKSGAYTFNSVAVGEYNLYITKQSYLTYTKAIMVDDECVLPTVDISKLAGDIVVNGKINTTDLSYLIRNFNGIDEISDLNGSGKVNSADLSALLGSFNASNYVG